MCHPTTQATLQPATPTVTGASSYSDLTAHVGHAINVVIYGGDASAAIECETCHTVLLGFQRIPDRSRTADLAALVALAQRHRLGEGDLDEHVLDAACDQGASANNRGLTGQLEYLLDEIGAEAARQAIEALARSRRRR